MAIPYNTSNEKKSIGVGVGVGVVVVVGVGVGVVEGVGGGVDEGVGVGSVVGVGDGVASEAIKTQLISSNCAGSLSDVTSEYVSVPCSLRVTLKT